jgi:hypothetical protein
MNDIQAEFTDAQKMLQDKILTDMMEIIRIIQDGRTSALAGRYLREFLQHNPNVAYEINPMHEKIRAWGSSLLEDDTLRADLTALVTGYDFIKPATWVVRDYLPDSVRRDTLADSFNTAARMNSLKEDFRFREAWGVIAHVSASPFPPVANSINFKVLQAAAD